MSELSSKHALISGGGSGIGAEIARTLAHAGARVTILGRREVPLQEIASSVSYTHLTLPTTPYV